MVITGCTISKEPIRNCQHPNFNEWKTTCLKKFDNQFSLESRVKQGMIIEYARRELVNINIDSQEKFYCRLNTGRKKDWQNLTLIYHYLEGEVNFVIQSFVFQDKNTCKGFAWSESLNSIKKNSDCSLYEQIDSFKSNYVNNGILIISTFDNNLNLKDTQMHFGVSHDQYDTLLYSYPKL